MLLSCSDKVSNITISPSSPKNCYKPISKIAPIYSVKTVSSSWWQCKLLGWIMPLSFRGVYQGGSITHRPKSEAQPSSSPSSPCYRQLVCCHGTTCCYCSGHKMVPSHTPTWQHWKLFNSSTCRTCRHRNKSPQMPAWDTKTDFDSLGLQLIIIIIYLSADYLLINESLCG